MSALIDPQPVETDAEIMAQIHAYEDELGIRMTEEQRANLRIARRLETMEERPRPVHPLGNHADPAEDQCTPRNRSDLRRCLWLYYDNGRPNHEPYRGTPLALQCDEPGAALSDQINQRQDTATGVALADRFVSYLDLTTALRWLEWESSVGRSHVRFLELVYQKRWSVEKWCKEKKQTDRTFRRRDVDAVDAVIRIVFRDSWTEAKSQDMHEET